MKKSITHQEVLNTMGGGDAIVSMFKKMRLFKFIDNELGKRSPRAEYKYSEVLIAWFITVCSGGKRLEHINNFRFHLGNHPAFKKAMSPDTVSKVINELSTGDEFHNKKVKHYLGKKTSTLELPNQVNSNNRINRLLVASAVELGLLIPGKKYILDYDTTPITTKIKGGRYIYSTESEKGYQPALVSINHIPLFLENRNGDSSPRFKLVDTIVDAIELLLQYGIIVDTVRVDAAAFSGYFVSTMEHNQIRFVTRPPANIVKKGHDKVFGWEESKSLGMELGTLLYKLNGVDGRIIVEGRKDCQYGVYTNDFDTPKDDVVQLYRNRGDSENVFKDLKNDFGWYILAKRKFNHNSTYLGIQAFCYILFTFLKRKLSQVLKFVKENMQLRTFITAFMRVGTKWIGTTLKFVGTRKDYKPLAGFI